jgi:glutamyl-tRNA synthetase
LEKLRVQAELEKRPFRYDNACRAISSSESEERAKAESFVVRLKVKDEEIVFNDIIRGSVKFAAGAIDDFVISKGLNNALYHLAVVVDDAEMEVSHVIRGEDGLSNTPKHICLQRALGYSTPIYAHLPLLLDENKKKLSKRSGDVSLFVKTLREEEGYLPETVVNGLVLLGWNPKTDQVVFTLNELEKIFDLGNVQKAGAVFSLARLNWLNKQHIKKLSAEDLVKRSQPFIEKAGIKVEKLFLSRLIQIERERITLLKEIPVLLVDLLNAPVLEKEKIPWKEDDKEKAKNALEYLLVKLDEFDQNIWDNQQLLQKTIIDLVDQSGKGRATMLWPMRYVLTGKEKSAGPQELAWLFGKSETIKRIRAAVVQLG